MLFPCSYLNLFWQVSFPVTRWRLIKTSSDCAVAKLLMSNSWSLGWNEQAVVKQEQSSSWSCRDSHQQQCRLLFKQFPQPTSHHQYYASQFARFPASQWRISWNIGSGRLKRWKNFCCQKIFLPFRHIRSVVHNPTMDHMYCGKV